MELTTFTPREETSGLDGASDSLLESQPPVHPDASNSSGSDYVSRPRAFFERFLPRIAMSAGHRRDGHNYELAGTGDDVEIFSSSQAPLQVRPKWQKPRAAYVVKRVLLITPCIFLMLL
jgi:hypothetical protein